MRTCYFQLTFAFWIISILICIPNLTKAQQLNFRNFSVEEGLPQSQIYAIAEDNYGHLFFGTRGGGLSRFDGLVFTNFTVQDGLPSNYIRCMVKDKTGKIWIGTDHGLAVFEGERFKIFRSRQGLYSMQVNALKIDYRGKLWIGTSKGIFRMEKDSIVRFGRKINAPLEEITALEEGPDHSMWAGTSYGIYRFLRNSKGWSMNYLGVKDGLTSREISTIRRVGKAMALGTYGKGMVWFNHGKRLILNTTTGLSSNTINDCLMDEENHCWIATNNGITEGRLAEGNFTAKRVITEKEGLAVNVIQTLFKDSFGNIWMGTSGGGVVKFSGESFSHFQEVRDVFGKTVYAITQDSAGNFWFGTSAGGVTLWDHHDFKRFGALQGFTDEKVKSLHVDNSQRLWLGTVGDGLFSFNGNRFHRFSIEDGMTSNFINAIASDTHGNIVAATAGGGVNVLRKTNEVINISPIRPKEGLGTDRILTILRIGNIFWLGGTKGALDKLQLMDSGRYSIRHYDLDTLQSGNMARSITGFSEKNLWIGTSESGTIHFDGKKFKRFGKNAGLTSDNIYAMVLDQDGNLWTGSEKGIDQFHLRQNGSLENIHHWGKPEGLTGIETVQNGFYCDRSGLLWFSTLKGLNVFDPQKRKHTQIPKVLITGINLFYADISKTPYGKKLLLNTHKAGNLELPYSQNHLTIRFVGLEQTNPESVRYKWRLEGYEKDYSPVQNTREAVYSSLPPGRYIFKVYASNQNDQWNEQPAIVRIIIHPPFWKTWWFIGLCCLLLLTMLMWSVRLYFKTEKQKNQAERERLRNERDLMELEQKALRLQMNPHFLYNCLNSIKGLVALDKSKEASLYISRFAKLMRLTLDETRSQSISLDSELEILQNYVSLENLSRNYPVKLVIKMDEQIQPGQMMISPMLLQPLIENCMVHAFPQTHEQGKIEVDFKLENELLHCTITDNGKGRKNLSENINAEEKTGSHALSITRERLDLLNRMSGKNSARIYFEDLNLQGHQGTSVHLLLPLVFQSEFHLPSNI